MSGATKSPSGAPSSRETAPRDERAPLAGRPRCATIAIAAVAVLGLSLTSCGGSDDDDETTELMVLAASSLTTAFDELETTYEDEHPDVDVKLSYDSSAILVEQVISGAPADVLATADTDTMADAVDADMIDGEPTIFARNTMLIATPPGNPAGIQDVTDLTDATVAVCVPEAPCGAATQKLFDLNNLDVQPATEEDNVSSVLTKVTSGEVDAGIVYVTDAQAAGDDVDTAEITHADEVINDDPIAIIAGSDNSDAAQDWVDLVLSSDGQQTLADLGFRTVSSG
ncbi:MAG TPA: molybdate ABC transporter substrate-binding protein [Nocardioidaceae bacterium]|nr:molybdate ABC transporter substrate-binding protein [Nocardioidaceae bacterium]